MGKAAETDTPEPSPPSDTEVLEGTDNVTIASSSKILKSCPLVSALNVVLTVTVIDSLPSTRLSLTMPRLVSTTSGEVRSPGSILVVIAELGADQSAASAVSNPVVVLKS